MKPAHGEYRRHERAALSLPVEVAFASDSIHTSTLNVSSSGVALERPHDVPLQAGQLVRIIFEKLTGLSLSARIVHVGDSHVGLSLYKSSISDADMTRLIDMAPVFQRLKVRAKRAFWTQTRRAGFLAANTLLKPVLVSAVKPEFLFAAYGTHKDVSTYFTPRMAKMLPSMVIGGLIRSNGKRGFMVASKYLENELESDPEKVRHYISMLREEFPGVKRIALVGRLPNFTLKAGLPLESPFVDGSMGTRFMIWDVARQMSVMPGYTGEFGITVLGGAGRIGNAVCEDLLRIFPQVVAYDSRYGTEEIINTEKGVVIRTSDPSRLKQHRLFIGLTHNGDVIGDLAQHMQSGSIIADDTHPCISLDIREKLANQGVKTLKIVLSHELFAMTPRMPNWNSRDIPGCLVEALVMLDHEDETARDFDLFQAAATSEGFHGRLINPLDE